MWCAYLYSVPSKNGNNDRSTDSNRAKAQINKQDKPAEIEDKMTDFVSLVKNKGANNAYFQAKAPEMLRRRRRRQQKFAALAV